MTTTKEKKELISKVKFIFVKSELYRSRPRVVSNLGERDRTKCAQTRETQKSHSAPLACGVLLGIFGFAELITTTIVFKRIPIRTLLILGALHASVMAYEATAIPTDRNTELLYTYA